MNTGSINTVTNATEQDNDRLALVKKSVRLPIVYISISTL